MERSFRRIASRPLSLNQIAIVSSYSSFVKCYPKHDNLDLQSGVIAVIVVSLLIFLGVVAYIVFNKIVESKGKRKDRFLQLMINL